MPLLACQIPPNANDSLQNSHKTTNYVFWIVNSFLWILSNQYVYLYICEWGCDVVHKYTESKLKWKRKRNWNWNKMQITILPTTFVEHLSKCRLEFIGIDSCAKNSIYSVDYLCVHLHKTPAAHRFQFKWYCQIKSLCLLWFSISDYYRRFFCSFPNKPTNEKENNRFAFTGNHHKRSFTAVDLLLFVFMKDYAWCLILWSIDWPIRKWKKKSENTFFTQSSVEDI